MPHHRLLSTPAIRLASAEDVNAICAMPSGGRWRHVTEAATALRGVALSLGSEEAKRRDMRVVLFEVERELAAVSAIRRAADPEIAHLITVVIHQEMRGCHLRARPRPPFCVVVLGATMKLAAGIGYRRIATHIANADRKGLRLAEGFSFARVGEADRDHGVFAARL